MNEAEGKTRNESMRRKEEGPQQSQVKNTHGVTFLTLPPITGGNNANCMNIMSEKGQIL